MSDPAHPLLPHLPLVEGIASSLARRKRLSREEAEDFLSEVRLKLLQDDAAALRNFEGRSKLRTYLSAVVSRHLVDFRRRRWGRWRPSAAAKRMGGTAVELERLIERDGRTFRDAVGILRRNHGVDESEEELAEMAGRLPQRTTGRRFEGDDALARLGGGPSPEEPLAESEMAATADRAESALNRALSDLDAEDRLLLKLCFERGLKISQIARTLGREQKPLYRRFQRLYRELRERLAAADLTASAITTMLDWGHAEIDVDYGVADPLDETPQLDSEEPP